MPPSVFIQPSPHKTVVNKVFGHSGTLEKENENVP